jgi:hypothetical protein
MLLLGTALVAVAGALFGNPWVTGAGSLVLLGLLAVHHGVIDPAVSRLTRGLLRGGLLFFALAVVVHLSGWTGLPPDGTDLVALVTDPERQWRQYVRGLVVAGCLIMACACFGFAVGQLPRGRLRRFGAAVPVTGGLTLVALLFLVLLETELFGSWTNRAVASGLVLGGYAWVMRRAVRRSGAAPVAVVGATVLVVAAWNAAADAWRSLPPQGGALTEFTVDVSVAVVVEVDNGPDVTGAGAFAVLLLGAVLTVLACARLSRADGA